MPRPLVYLSLPLILGPVLGYAGRAALRVEWSAAIHTFLTGPGSIRRILLLLFALLNLKNMPLMWTYNLLGPFFSCLLGPEKPSAGPRALFRPVAYRSRASLLDTDYNLHKSNSTYLADLDVARSRLTAHLWRPALRALVANPRTGLVVDPRTRAGLPATGTLRIVVGAAWCSFRREIPALSRYEVQSRVLAWDRKWFYFLSRFVPVGAPAAASAEKDGEEGVVYATAVTTLVVKLGRLNVHPAVVLGKSGLLPERPGGWTSGPDQLGCEPLDASGREGRQGDGGEWTWQRVEAMRRRGMEMARHAQELESLYDGFGGEDGVETVQVV